MKKELYYHSIRIRSMINIVSKILSNELFEMCDDYSNNAIKDKSKLITNSLWDSEIVNESSQVFISQLDIKNILHQATLGVLSSKSEGLPVALLEYGLASLPVVATNVESF